MALHTAGSLSFRPMGNRRGNQRWLSGSELSSMSELWGSGNSRCHGKVRGRVRHRVAVALDARRTRNGSTTIDHRATSVRAQHHRRPRLAGFYADPDPATRFGRSRRSTGFTPETAGFRRALLAINAGNVCCARTCRRVRSRRPPPRGGPSGDGQTSPLGSLSPRSGRLDLNDAHLHDHGSGRQHCGMQTSRTCSMT